jgi:pimeloyl-ACP methyl ester carboxylesterase
VQGSGYPVLLLHGQWAGSSASVAWGRTIGPLADAGFTVYALDQAGFGGTERPDDASIARRLEHVLAFVEELGLDRLAVWGCSDGSYLAAKLALERGGVDALILMASGSMASNGSGHLSDSSHNFLEQMRRYEPTRASAESILRQLIVNPECVDDALIEEALKTSSGDNLEAHRARMSVGRPEPLLHDLQYLKPATLLLWGLKDQVPVEKGLDLLRALPNAEMHVLQRCGHWIQRDQPDRANDLVIRFLQRTCAP